MPKFFVKALLSIILVTFMVQSAEARRGFRIRSFGTGGGGGESIIKVMELPDIAELKRKDGIYIDLGFKYSSRSKSGGVWVGYVGSSRNFLPLKKGSVQSLLAIAGVLTLPPIPTAQRGETGVSTDELIRRAVLLGFAHKYNLKARRWDESLTAYETRVFIEGNRKKYKLREKKPDESLFDYQEWQAEQIVVLDKARAQRKASSWAPSMGTIFGVSFLVIFGFIFLKIRRIFRWITGADKQQPNFDPADIEARIAAEVQSMAPIQNELQPQQGFGLHPTVQPAAQPSIRPSYTPAARTTSASFGQRGA